MAELRARMVAGLATVVLSLAGCGLQVADVTEPQGPLQLSTADVNCLEAAVPAIKQYFIGRASASEIAGVFTCASGTVDSFLAHTRGSNAHYYTDIELRAFMERYFLGNIRVSDALLREAMRIKQLLVGGDANRFTRAELQNLKKTFSTLKDEALRLRPHIAYLTLNVESNGERVDAAAFDRAISDFSRSMEIVGGLLDHSRAPYELRHFDTLLREIQKLYSDWQGPSWLLGNMPTIAAAKALLTQPNQEQVEPKEWPELFLSGARLYSIYLRFEYRLSTQPVLAGENLDQLVRVSEDLFFVLEQAVKIKPDGIVGYELIDRLLEELLRSKALELPIRETTLKKALRTLFGRILNPPVEVGRGRMKRSEVAGLTFANLLEMRDLVLGWLEMQRLWRELSVRAVAADSRLAGQPIPLALVRQLWPTLSTPYQRPFQDLGRVFQRAQPLTFSGDDTVVFVRDPRRHFVDQDVFNSLNWKTHAVRAAVMGFAVDPKVAETKGLDNREWMALFDELRDAAVDLKFIAPKDDQLWGSLLEEINVFTLSGNGDKRVSFDEGLDFIANALSSSFIWHGVYDELLLVCPPRENDVFGVAKVEIRCFRKVLRQGFERFFRRLPQWVKMAESWSADEFAGFQVLLERAARPKGASASLIDSTDVSRLSMVMHYIEAVFTRFDTNGSGVLSLNEADKAFPVLRELLAEVSGFDSDDDLYPLFTYLLHHGEPPKKTPIGILRWLSWKGSRDQWVINADRRTLLLIIANLNDAR